MSGDIIVCQLDDNKNNNKNNNNNNKNNNNTSQYDPAYAGSGEIRM